ncbi:uncharacterized protein METZ01_LOCUS22727 [marine metagenome]|uniref:Uncharacterized protein n=1 Tax=marine metagenome TaxID=408172 RepID=A0A381PWT9_9ZZZZ
MVGRVGIEPTTSRLKAECSTSELTPQYNMILIKECETLEIIQS